MPNKLLACANFLVTFKSQIIEINSRALLVKKKCGTFKLSSNIIRHTTWEIKTQNTF